jgi:hypothetical protein
MKTLVNKKTEKTFEISEKDFPERLDWEKAKIQIKKLGDSWRLPTIDELETIYDFRYDILGLDRSDWYWSSTGNGRSTSFCFDFKNGERNAFYKEGKGLIRPVRNVKK